MKFNYLLIGIALVLMLCISPVSALSGEDFVIIVDKSGDIESYKYCIRADWDEKYIKIYVYGTFVLNSVVTFKPANIEGAPVMVVDTNGDERVIYLPRSVDEWEIKYYSTRDYKIKEPDPKYLKNYGVVNLKQFFGKYISKGEALLLELSWGQFITPASTPWPRYSIPDVD